MNASTSQPDSAAVLPRVVIVGRPNVGKSTLLNRMCGSRIAIVEPTAGVNRDRIAVPARLNTPDGERWYEVVDTGGIGIVDRHDLGPHVESQVRMALDRAHLVLFMVDVRSGIMHMDQNVARTLRPLKVPVLLVVNKTEGEKLHWDVDEFRRLGIHGEPIAISAQNGEGLTNLYSQIHAACPDAPPMAWCIWIVALDRAKRLPGVPEQSNTVPMLAAIPTQMVDTSGLISWMVS